MKVCSVVIKKARGEWNHSVEEVISVEIRSYIFQKQDSLCSMFIKSYFYVDFVMIKKKWSELKALRKLVIGKIRFFWQGLHIFYGNKLLLKLLTILK